MAFWRFAFSHPAAFGAWTPLHLLDAAVLQPALVFLLLLGARGLGERLLGRSLLTGVEEERPLFAAGLGLGVLPLLVALVGAWRFDGGVALGFWLLLGALAWTGPPLPRPRLNRLDGAEALAAAVVALAVLACWVQASAPPTTWDALAYHLEVPKRWLQDGRVGADPCLTIAKNPVQTEALFLLALGIGRDTLAQQLHLALACLCAAGIFLFGRRRLGARAGALAAAVFACQPLFYQLAPSANVDFAVCFFGLLAAWALDLWRESRRRPGLVLAAVLAGFACGAKILGLWLAIALTAALLLELALAPRAKGKAADVLAWAAAGAAAGLPWYALNWRWLGDPVWPYYSDVFGGGPAAVALYRRIIASVTEGFPATLPDLAKLPYRLLARGDAFGAGPQYLAAPVFLAAAWLAARRRGTGLSRAIGAVCAVDLLIWFLVAQNYRYAVAVVPWACLLVGAALDDAWTAGRAPQAAAAAVVAALAGFMLANQTLSNELFALSEAKPSQPGATSRERYLSLSLQDYDLFRWIDAELPPDARILFFGDLRGYYLRHPFLIGDPLNEFQVGYAALDTPAQLEGRLRALGVTHVLASPEPAVYKGDREYYRRVDALMRAFLRERAAPVKESNGLMLYALARP